MGKHLSEDEQIAMTIVTFCGIGDVRTYFEAQVNLLNSDLDTVTSTMQFKPPKDDLYLDARNFLKDGSVQGALKKGLFKEGRSSYVKAHQQAIEYIKRQGLMQ